MSPWFMQYFACSICLYIFPLEKICIVLIRFSEKNMIQKLYVVLLITPIHALNWIFKIDFIFWAVSDSQKNWNRRHRDFLPNFCFHACTAFPAVGFCFGSDLIMLTFVLYWMYYYVRSQFTLNHLFISKPFCLEKSFSKSEVQNIHQEIRIRSDPDSRSSGSQGPSFPNKLSGNRISTPSRSESDLHPRDQPNLSIC